MNGVVISTLILFVGCGVIMGIFFVLSKIKLNDMLDIIDNHAENHNNERGM